jgi:hypothetical protein
MSSIWQSPSRTESKSYFPKAPVDVVAGGLAANCTDEQYKELLEQMAPIAEQVAEKLNLQ